MKIKQIYDFIDIFRASFKKQFYTYIIVAVLGVVFNYSLVIGCKWLAMVSGYMFVVFGSFGGSLFAFSFANNAWTRIGHIWRAKEVAILPQIQELADKMGVKKFKLKVRTDIGRNAYALGNDIVLSDYILGEMQQKKGLAIVAHEFGHLKGKHSLKISLLLYPLMVLACINYLALPKTILYISLMSATLVFCTPISWYYEYKADEATSKYVGSEEMANALLDISINQNRDEPSLSHPSINDRVKRLREET